MEVTFSRNMDGDALVLVDGAVVAIAKKCEGFEDYVVASMEHRLRFQLLSENSIGRKERRGSKARFSG